MKKIIYTIVFATGLLGHYKAQDSVVASHGGKLKAAGYYYIEVVECYEYLEIYFYEKSMCPILNFGVNGSVDFYYPDNTCATSKLYPYGIDAFTAEAGRECYTSCEVKLNSIGLSVGAFFSGFGEDDDDCKDPAKKWIQN